MFVLIILGFIVLVLGIIGCIVPIIPGPPLCFLSLIFLSFARQWQTYTPALITVLGAATLAATIADYVLPAVVSKRKGASKPGVWGSIVGMIAGIFLFPPFGVFIGAFVGAVLGEFLLSSNRKNALRAGWGVFLGTLFGTVMKQGVCGVIGYFFVRGVFA